MIKRQKNRKFELVSKYKPAGDQQQAIDKLTAGFEKGYKEQILEGATGTGKTFTMANIIAKLNKPTLVISHNKTLVDNYMVNLKAFSRIMQSSILFHTMITINLKLTCRNRILILKRIHQLMMKLISCVTLLLVH